MSKKLDTVTDADGNIESFLVLHDDQSVERIGATPENVLRYHEGLNEFLDDEQVLEFDDGSVVVQSRSDDRLFYLQVNGDTVETTPKYSEDVLRGIKQALDGNTELLRETYANIRANQVRRPVINALIHIFGDEKFRIDSTASGWLVDGFFLVTWEAELYSTKRGPEEPSLERRGGEIVEADSSNEFIGLRHTGDVEPQTVTLDGEEYTLTEREMLFLQKVEWLLDGPKYHPNESYWKHLHLNHTDLDI